MGPIWAELTKTVDAKNAKVGDELTARLLQDVKVDKKVVLHRGAKLVGHVVQVKPHTKEAPESVLGIVFDKAVGKGNEEMGLHATIQAVAARPEPVLAPDSGVPTSMGSRGAPMGGGGGMGSGGGGGVMPVPTQGAGASDSGRGSVDPGGAMSGRALAPDSKGVFGIPDTSLGAPAGSTQPPVVICKTRNVKLESGTQLVLQTAQASR
jgi:hypothetical protein